MNGDTFSTVNYNPKRAEIKNRQISLVSVYPGELPLEMFNGGKQQALDMCKFMKDNDVEGKIENIKNPVNTDNDCVIIVTLRKI